ncbi:hypothetical protein EGI31_05695 [Lacihabitans soyangensis]|uniref:Serpin domain-containing protein n=2 Tax=Lacihabitans soyangensis TaxID=869394 RepID=A0AAE3H010_9BACT|nr:hypothetical protein [Lacihabitans soyangensis]
MTIIMNKLNIAFFASILIIIQSCSLPEKNFSSSKDLSAYKKTDFIPTLENKISKDKNAIYCVSLLNAWNEIRKIINEPIIVKNEFDDLTLLNNSKSFIGVLKQNEYSSSGQVDGDKIKVQAEFKNNLNFEHELNSFKDSLVFENTKVASFGTKGLDYMLWKVINISYYKNDDNFIVKLQPKNKEHEILLFKSSNNYNTMSEMYYELIRLTKLGMEEEKDEKQKWKYAISDEDLIVIPKFDFNIEHDFKTITGKTIIANKEPFYIEKAWQRIAFHLDEYGSRIETEAEFEAAAAALGGEERPKPKVMKFDKPFLLILKRTDAKNPYFSLWTSNSELMLKE